MKCYEIKKGNRVLPRGRVMMGMDVPTEHVEFAQATMDSWGYQDTKCSEEADTEGETTLFFVIAREDMRDFKASWGTVKTSIQKGEV